MAGVFSLAASRRAFWALAFAAGGALAQVGSPAAGDEPASAPAPGLAASAPANGTPEIPPGAALPAAAAASDPRSRAAAPPPLPAPGEFERYVNEMQGVGVPPLRRFGRIEWREDRFAALQQPQVPPQYMLQPGDELQVALWGGVDADWRLRVDRSGRVVLPRAGPVRVAGIAVGELTPLLQQRLARVYRNFELSVSVSDVSAIRIHVTGFVERPGAYTVPGLTTLVGALTQAQGPAAGGSFRRIRLLRAGRTEAEMDLYALLAHGDRSADRLLQPEDVIQVEPVGPQAAVLGSVNRAAIFEFRDGETVADLLALAGGFSSLADRRRAAIERVATRSDEGVVELALPAQAAMPLADGDVLRVFSAADAQRPMLMRNKRVRVEGEVRRPGDYVLPPAATLADAVAAAGGLTAAAWPFGTEFRRESVRRVQQANYERALRELESELARAAATRRDDDDRPRDAAARQLLDRLRQTRPEGRVVLNLAPTAEALPALALEDGDRLLVPARPRSVGVFGSVYNSGSFLYEGQDGQNGDRSPHTLGDYLRLAGGPTASADADSVFVVRADGSVLSARQQGRWSGASRFAEAAALPGDTLFVPAEIDRVTWVRGAKDWTQILYQFGLGVAALMAIN